MSFSIYIPADKRFQSELELYAYFVWIDLIIFFEYFHVIRKCQIMHGFWM